jgi:hypothetical protein
MFLLYQTLIRLPQRILKDTLMQAAQKGLDARRAWFDKLTMTNCAACR